MASGKTRVLGPSLNRGVQPGLDGGGRGQVGHGGPNAQDCYEPARRVILRERLAAAGYAALQVNYRIATDTCFKAAVAGAGSGNPLSMCGNDEYAVQYEQEVGTPWAQAEPWLRLSYRFFKADGIKTPTLLLGGGKDFHVPNAGGEQMYQALKQLGASTQWVVYPGQFHGMSVPSYLRDWEGRFVGWMDRDLR